MIPGYLFLSSILDMIYWTSIHIVGFNFNISYSTKRIASYNIIGYLPCQLQKKRLDINDSNVINLEMF